MKPRPSLGYSTIKLLWRPQLASSLVRSVHDQRGAIKPKFFKSNNSIYKTEAEKYTLELVEYMCLFAFAGVNGKEFPGRKQIWAANALWIRHHLKIGSGIDRDGLLRCIDLYTEHVNLDNTD